MGRQAQKKKSDNAKPPKKKDKQDRTEVRSDVKKFLEKTEE